MNNNKMSGNKVLFKPGNMLYPLPVVMVSCGKEKPNIITVAWAGTVCSSPACISISIRKERYSYELIRRDKEFVVNVVGKNLAKKLDYCGVKSGRDVDKFKECNFHKQYMNSIETCGILEATINIGCKVIHEIDLGSHTMFIGEVVDVLVDEQYMEGPVFRFDKSKPFAYSHGNYFELGKEIGRFGFSVKKKKEKETKDKKELKK